MDGIIRDKDGCLVKPLSLDDWYCTDSCIRELCQETTRSMRLVIVFTSSRQEAERLAAFLAGAMGAVPVFQKRYAGAPPASRDDIIRWLGGLHGASAELAALVAKGFAFHHAGLPLAHRDAIKTGFRGGPISVTVCTPTLAAGVNLPAQRVILKDDFSLGMMGPVEYGQMLVRAGRPGMDEQGKAILTATPADIDGQQQLFDLMKVGWPSI